MSICCNVDAKGSYGEVFAASITMEIKQTHDSAKVRMKNLTIGFKIFLMLVQNESTNAQIHVSKDNKI